MAEYYLALRHAHIGLAMLSVGIFVVRGVLMLVESPRVHAAWLRYPSYLVDSLLLSAALMLTSVIHQYPFGTDWLTVKVVLLVVYIVLGSIALQRGRTRAIRAGAFIAALLVVGFLVSVARTHHPLGLFARYPAAHMATLEPSVALAGLRAHHLFAGLSPPQLQRVLTSAQVVAAESGLVLFDRGQPASHFYVVLEGQVNLTLYSKAGEEKIVDILGPGQSFAEAVMFMSGPVYPVSAMAVGNCRIARFPSSEYISILRESPETCLRMLGHLSQRLHMRIREIEYLTLESATNRLVRMLESRLPKAGDGPHEIQLQESRQEIASRLSMKPETLSRILRTLADGGVIVVHGRALQVPSRARLTAVLDAAV